MNTPLASPGEPQDSFAALSAAVHPAWHQALLRLASATERVAVRFDAWGAATSADGTFLKECRDLVEVLIDFIDEADAFAQTECEVNGDEADQSYREGWSAADNPMEDDEDSDCDEDSDPGEESDTGIADWEGLYEQLGTRDWQQGAMA